METDLRAGIAIYNAGGYHPAHDAWEDHWLALEKGTDDEQFLHGLIQFTAAVHHGHEGNWAGLLGLAESALEYLADLPATYHGVDLGPVRCYLSQLAADPEHVEREAPPRLTHEGEAITPADLSVSGVSIVATILAEEVSGYDESVVADAIAYAQQDDETGQFEALVRDFTTEANRDLVYQRLAEHVERRRSREADVDGLFE